MLALIHSQLGLSCQGIVSLDNETTEELNNSTTIPGVKNSFSLGCRNEATSEQLMGNPLELDEIVDLSMESKLFSQDESERIPVSRLINLSHKRPFTQKPVSGYKDRFLYYISEEKMQLFGLFPLTNSSKRVLWINVNYTPDCTATVKDLRCKHIPFASEHQCEFEASYQFPNAMFYAKFDACEPTVLSPPPSFVRGTLVTQLRPYESDSPCSSLLADIMILKVMFDAYENDFRTWTSIGDTPTPDQLLVMLPGLFRSVYSTQLDAPEDGCFSDQKLIGIMSNRYLDPTEVLWNTFKHVSNVVQFRSLMRIAIRYLLENRDLIRLSRSNNTRLATYLRDTTARVSQQRDLDLDNIMSFQIEYLLEIGLNKLINDCLALLETAIPEVASLPCVVRENTGNFGCMWSTLHHLYKAACLFMSFSTSCSKQSFVHELRNMLNTTDPKDEWRTAVYGGPSGEPFVLKHSFPLSVSELVAPIISFPPTLWIMRLDAEKPMRTSVRLVYELTAGHSTKNYICHEMKLVDSYWPN